MATHKNHISIQISAESKAALDQINNWSGMDRKMILDRLLRWFGKAPDELQAAVMMNVPNSLRRVHVETMLNRLDELIEANQSVTPKATPDTIKPNFHGRPKSKPQFAAKSGPRSSPGQPKPKP